MLNKNLPINLFGSTMGISGLTMAWAKAVDLNLAHKIIFDFLKIFASIIFLFLLISYILKIFSNFAEVKEEFKNPVKINFFASISFSLLLLSAAWHSQILWLIASIGHFTIFLIILDFWIFKAKFSLKDLNPAWFIPPVANLLIPITGANYGFLDLNYFIYSFSLMFWLILLTFLFYRLIFLEKLPTALNPTLFILLAPPTLAFLAYISLTGKLDIFAKNLYFLALFFLLCLFLEFKLFLKTPFSLASWAYSFPLAAFTIATFTMAELSQKAIYLNFGIFLLLLISIIIAVLFFKTIIALKNKKI